MGLDSNLSAFKRVKTTTTYADGRKSSYESYAPNLGGFVSIMPTAMVVIFAFYMLIAALKIAMIILLVLPFLLYVIHYRRKLKFLINESNFQHLDEKIYSKIISASKYNSFVSIIIAIYLVAIMVYMSVLVFTTMDENEIRIQIIDAFVNPFYYTILFSSAGLLLYHLTLAPFMVRKALKLLEDENPDARKFILKRGFFQKLALLLMMVFIAITAIKTPNLEGFIKEPLKYPQDQRDNFRSLVNSIKLQLFSEFTPKDIEEQAQADNTFYIFSIANSYGRNYLFRSYTMIVKPLYEADECKGYKTILYSAKDAYGNYIFDGSVPIIQATTNIPGRMFVEGTPTTIKTAMNLYDINIITREHPGIGGHDEFILADFKIGDFSWLADNGERCYGSAEVIPR